MKIYDILTVGDKMKNFVEAKVVKDELYVFIDESGTYKRKTVKKAIKKYNEDGVIPGNGLDYFNISAAVIPGKAYNWAKVDVKKLKSQFSSEMIKNYSHRVDLSYSAISAKEPSTNYSDVNKFFKLYSKILQRHKVKSFSVGYNFKTVNQELLLCNDNIYLYALSDLIGEIEYSFNTSGMKYKYKKVNIVIELMSNQGIVTGIKEIAQNHKNKKFNFYFCNKGNFGNEMVDYLAYGHARYYRQDLYLQINNMFSDFPNHKTKSLKYNKVKSRKSKLCQAKMKMS